MNNCDRASGAQGCGPANRRNFKEHNRRLQFMGYKRPLYNVPINVEENENQFLVSVYATGFGKENIKIEVVDDVLFISGSKEKVDKKAFTRQEFPIKNFERTLGLNKQVNVEAIAAKSDNGILKITLPKTVEAQAKPRSITVE